MTRLSLLVAASLVAGCMGYRHRETADIEWPRALLAQWSEGGGTDSRDSTVLAFGRGGFLEVQRLRVRVVDGRTVTEVRSEERLRWWTEPLRSNDVAGPRQFCFTARPGRGHSCVRYEIDTLAQPGLAARRRLTLGKLVGRSPAVLLER